MQKTVKVHFDLSLVDGEVVFKLKNAAEVKARLRYTFEPTEETIMLSSTLRIASRLKTTQQLRYIRGYLLPLIHEELKNNQGYEGSSEDAYTALKLAHYNESPQMESLADGERLRVADFIDYCFRFALIELKLDVKTPEEYKNGK